MVSLILWILCIAVSVYMIIYVLKCGLILDSDTSKEGFITNIQMTSCPLSSTSYITNSGDTNCCDGDIVSKQCNGRVICSLSPRPPNGILSCSDWMNREWTRRSERFCPSSMPNYFGPIHRDNSAVEGCSESPTSLDGSVPQSATSPRCKIYSTEEQDRSSMDSCYNAKNLAALAPPGSKATQISLPISGPMPNCIDTSMLNNTILPALKPYVPKITDLIQNDPCSLSGVLPICGVDCSAPKPSSTNTQNPTGYVISGDDIQGEIPVQAYMTSEGPGGSSNYYWAQNNDRIIAKSGASDEAEQFSFVGKLSEIGWSDKSTKELSEFGLFRKYLETKRSTFKPGKYKIRKL